MYTKNKKNYIYELLSWYDSIRCKVYKDKYSLIPLLLLRFPSSQIRHL